MRRRGAVGVKWTRLSVMLRVHCVQLFYNLQATRGMEDLLHHEVEAVEVVSWDLRLTEALPDETTILNFRAWCCEKHGLGEGLCRRRCPMPRPERRAVPSAACSRGCDRLTCPSIIDAPSSTKNGRRARDPEMHLDDRQGKQWPVRDEGAHRGGRRVDVWRTA